MIQSKLNDLFAKPHIMEYLIKVGDKSFDMSKIVSINADKKLFDDLTVGEAVVQEAKVEILTEELLNSTSFEILFRICTEEEISEFISFGEYFIDTREWGYRRQTLVLKGFDALIKADYVYKSDEGVIDANTLIYNVSERMGVRADFIARNLMLPYEKGKKARDYLKDIAAYLGGNLTISNGILKLVKLKKSPIVNNLDIRCEELQTSTSTVKIGRVSVDTPEGYYHAGDSGFRLVIKSPLSGQYIANTILDTVKDFTYVGFTADKAQIPMTVELGDCIEINEVNVYVASLEFSFDIMGDCMISAPDFREVDLNYDTETAVREAEVINSVGDVDLSGIERDVKGLSDNYKGLNKDFKGLNSDFGKLSKAFEASKKANTRYLDFSKWDSGILSEVVGNKTINYNITFDTLGLPVKFESGEGLVLEINW